jgi:hypothetical protein
LAQLRELDNSTAFAEKVRALGSDLCTRSGNAEDLSKWSK